MAKRSQLMKMVAVSIVLLFLVSGFSVMAYGSLNSNHNVNENLKKVLNYSSLSDPNFEMINLTNWNYITSISSNGNLLILTGASLSGGPTFGIFYNQNYTFLDRSNLLPGSAQRLVTSCYGDGIFLIGGGTFSNPVLLEYNPNGSMIDLSSNLVSNNNNFGSVNSIAFGDNIFLIGGASNAFSPISFFYPVSNQFVSLTNNIPYYFATNHNLWNGNNFIMVGAKAGWGGSPGTPPAMGLVYTNGSFEDLSNILPSYVGVMGEIAYNGYTYLVTAENSSNGAQIIFSFNLTSGEFSYLTNLFPAGLNINTITNYQNNFLIGGNFNSSKPYLAEYFPSNQTILNLTYTIPSYIKNINGLLKQNNTLIIAGQTLNNNAILLLNKNNYLVTFTESGLPTGTSWSVTFNGQTESSTGSFITFSGIPPGTYTYTVTPPSGYFASPSSGSVTVTSSNVTEPISFSQQTYSLTIYSEDGGSVTYVYPDGNIEQVPVGGSSTIQVPAGAEVSILAYPSAGYLFSAFKPSGAVTLSQLTPLPGTGGGYSCVATVNGNGAVNVTFIKATFSILATEVGGDNPYTLDFIANATAFANIKSANSASGNNNPYYDYADYLVLYMKNPSAYPIYKVVIYDGSGNQVTGEAEQNILQGVLVWAHMEIFGIYYEGNANNLEPFFSSLNSKIWEQDAILAGLNIVNIPQMVNELAADMGPPYGELYSQVVGLILGVLHGEPYLVAEYGDSVAQQIVSQLYQDGLVSSPTQPYDALQLVNEIISNPSSFLQVFPQIYKTAYGTQPSPTALDYANEYVFDFANNAAVGGLTSVLLYFMRNPIFVASGVDTTVTGTIGWTETVTTWTLSGAVTDALVSAAEGAAAGVAATYFAIYLEQNIPALLQSEITYEQAVMPLYQGLNASLNQMVTEGEVNLTAAANAQVDATLSESIAAQWFQADYNMTKENVLYWGQNKQQEMSEDQQFAQALNYDVNLDRSFLSSLSAYAQSLVSGGDPPAINESYEVPTPVESEWTLLPANGMVGFDVNSSTAAFALHFGNYTVYAGANGLNSTYPYAFLLRTQNVTRLVTFGTPSGVYLVNSSSSLDVTVLALQASNATLITKSYVNSSVIAAVPLEERSNNTFEVVPSRYDLTFVIGPGEPPLAAIALNNSVYTFTHGKLMISGLPTGTYSYELLLPKGYSTSLASGYVNLSANRTLTFVVTRSNSNALYYALVVVVAVSVLAAVFSVGLIRKHSKKGR